MSSCLSGGSRAFGFDLDIVKSTSTSSSSRNSPTSFSSPSSTLSESSNNALSTRKPRTPRKRPNQIYNEAAVLLSSVYPTIFPTKPCSTLPNINATTAPTRGSLFFDNSSELLPLHRPLPSYNRIKLFKNSPGIGHENPQLAIGGSDDFETSCILDEEMESIDTIMGVASAESGPALDSIFVGHASGIPYGLGLMMRRGVTALRQVDREDWWRFPVIDMCHISPRLSSKEESSSRSNHKSGSTDQKKLKKKKKNMEKQEFEPNFVEEDMRPEPVVPNLTSSLMLKLNYKEVVNAWSDRGWPFDELPEPDAHAMMLAQIDLFGDGGGVRREASVLRYKEKRRTRLFSKKIIRYQVRKVNADCRPRMKGRFVRRPNCQTVKKI